MTLKEILDSTEELNSTHFIGTDKNTVHGFVDFFYEKEFEKYKEKEISLLEIGIEVGGSLYLWGKFFKNGKILGVDIEDKVREKWKTLPNVKYLISDAYDEKFVDSLPSFDIIIDDGPHSIESQVDCIKKYLPKLNSGGILIIEDIQDERYFEILKNNTPDEFKNRTESLNLRHARGRYDDLLFIIRK